MIERLRQFSLKAFFLVLGLSAPGCSGGDELPREAVTGAVTLDGQPLADGAISFIPVGGPTGPTVGGGSAITNGQFSIDREHGLVPGTYNVSINSRVQAGTNKLPGLPKSKAESQKDIIPANYNSKTTLTAGVKKGGSNAFTFDLQSK